MADDKVVRMSDGEKNDILLAIKKGQTIVQVAKDFGRAETTIIRLLRQFRPTNELARAMLLSKASELVERVTEKADVDQLMDILSRPNIGVLEPVVSKSGAGTTNNFGIAVSVQTGSLAAVNESEYKDGMKRIDPQPDADAKTLKLGSVAIGQLYSGD